MNNPEKAVQTSTSNRMGEKIGWIGGWTGGFFWVFAIAIVWFVRGAILEGVLGVAIFIVAEILVVIFAPWRHPETRYYLLMLPIYILFLASVGWAIWSFGGIGQSGLHSWNLLWIFPCLSPMITIGWRRWVDFQPSGIDNATRLRNGNYYAYDILDTTCSGIISKHRVQKQR